MRATSYRLVTVWQVNSGIDDLMAVLEDVEDLPRWWPAVYLSSIRLTDGGAAGVGRQTAMRTKGWLPYTLDWVCTLTEPITERGFAIVASGDLTGCGNWTFEPEGPVTRVTFDWRISAEKPLLRRLGRFFAPILAANHRWAMARGRESLEIELIRRRGAGPGIEEPNQPPEPTFRWLSRK